MALSSEAGFMSDAPFPSSAPTPRTPGFLSSSAGGIANQFTETEEAGFADDHVPAKPGAGKTPRRDPGDIPRIEDRIGILVQEHFEAFIENFVEDETTSSGTVPISSAPTTDKFYVAMIHNMRRMQLSTFYVDYKHLASWQNGGLADGIMRQFYRFLPFLTSALHNMIAKYEPQYFREHRQPTTAQSTSAGSESGGESSSLLPSGSNGSGGDMGNRTSNQQTDKLFSIAFYNLPLISRVRSLRAAQIGQLLSISGTVTRTSEVRPELYTASFVCEACRTVVSNVEQIFRYTEPTQCPNETCSNRIAWQLDIRQSTFVDWQKVRIQENSSEIPTGSMPRTMDVILRGEMVDRAKAGEKCIFTGALIVVPDVSQLGLPGMRPTAVRDDKGGGGGRANTDAGGTGVTGLKALGVRDLTYRLAFLASMVTPDISTGSAAATASARATGSVEDVINSLTRQSSLDAETVEEAQAAVLAAMNPAEIEELRQMVHSDHIYARLVDSVAPMVYGHEIVKKGILLQLLSGVGKTTPEGMQLRGDINICIVGDPSTSKSQFLKYVCSFAPRAVYTSGKASSAAGLTAAVVKDEETGEFTIEAGALMLADNGICCIDEFDKMDIADQVAIHEAMEQQTISIAKAGIQATLNARTSILAAANPVGGRYNRKLTLRSNINMSAPIMSRFDLFFVVLDECNEQIDTRLAQHIVGIHQLRDMAIDPEFSTEQLQRYIRFARTFRPEFTPEAKEVLVARYKELRSDDAQGGVGRNSYRITVRQLESMIRLSEAIAKVSCVEEVSPKMVTEAFHLLRQSIISVEHDNIEMDEDEIEEEEAALAGAAAARAAAAAQGAQPMLPGQASASSSAVGDVDMEDGQTLRRAAAQASGVDGEDEMMMEEKTSARRKLTITYDQYIAMVNLFVQRVHEEERGSAAAAAATAGQHQPSSDSGDGVPGETLLQWYLEQKEAQLDDEAAYEHERALAKMVLKKMVKEHILMAIRAEAPEAGDATAPQQGLVYVLHPNCAIEEV